MTSLYISVMIFEECSITILFCHFSDSQIKVILVSHFGDIFMRVIVSGRHCSVGRPANPIAVAIFNKSGSGLRIAYRMEVLCLVVSCLLPLIVPWHPRSHATDEQSLVVRTSGRLTRFDMDTIVNEWLWSKHVHIDGWVDSRTFFFTTASTYSWWMYSTRECRVSNYGASTYKYLLFLVLYRPGSVSNQFAPLSLARLTSRSLQCSSGHILETFVFFLSSRIITWTQMLGSCKGESVLPLRESSGSSVSLLVK